MTLTQETRKASNRQPQLTPKTTDKEEQQQQQKQPKLVHGKKS